MELHQVQTTKPTQIKPIGKKYFKVSVGLEQDIKKTDITVVLIGTLGVVFVVLFFVNESVL